MQSPLTGYQLSKLSGVPRSRIYETLERLAARGYAVALQAEPTRYSPLSVPELLAQLREDFDSSLSALDSELTQLPDTQLAENIWNLRGREDILRRAQSMITKAQQSVYIVGWGEPLRALQRELEAASTRRIRVVLITCGEYKLAMAKHYHHAFEKELVQEKCENSLNVVVDSAEVLIGKTSPAETCQAAWSRSAALVFITEEYIRHEVYIHKIVERFGEALHEGLRAALLEGLQEVPYHEPESR